MRMIIVIWLVLWINFIVRDLYKYDYLDEYKVLIRSNADEKHAYTYGKNFYEFLRFVKEELPENAHYEFIGIPDFSLDSRRGIYYLYPCLNSKDPDYILVYNESPVGTGLSRGWYSIGKRPVPTEFKPYAKLDNKRFILKKN